MYSLQEIKERKIQLSATALLFKIKHTNPTDSFSFVQPIDIRCADLTNCGIDRELMVK